MKERSKNKTRRRTRNIVAAIAALAGAGLLLYPGADNLLYANKIAVEKEAFLTRIQEMNNPGSPGYDDVDNYGNNNDIDNSANEAPKSGPFEELYQYLMAENERLYMTGQDELTDAFSYQTAGIDLSGYGLKDGCIGYLEAPTIGVLMPIYLGANTENMKKGAVHMTQTSYPIGGDNTNAVIAAHRGGTREMLRNIHQIQIGDEIIITNFRERLVYRAVEVRIILPTQIGEVKIQEGHDLLTLLSCNPLGKNYQRYVLYCERQS